MSISSDMSSNISDVIISEQTCERQEEDVAAQGRARSRSRAASGLPSLQTAWETSKGMSRPGETFAAESATREDERDVSGVCDDHDDTSDDHEKGSEETSAHLRDSDYKEQGPPAGYFRDHKKSSVLTESSLADFAEQYRRGSSLVSSTSGRTTSQGSALSGFSRRSSSSSSGASWGSVSSGGSEGRTQRLSSILKKPNRSLVKEQALNEFSKTDEHLAYIRDEALKNQVELPIGLLITMKKEVLTVIQETAKEYKKTVGPNHRLTMDALQRVDELTEEIKRMGF
ncbi:Hypp2584 [Branchiostoma lanceolatum]|uniref:Hypp2584 protein n=1 Tax=Branchiostoma lanceolatum TaxID=7740 RepID=A0A8K0EU45_BRALA|nr:Hypp2584 [Branchiostoma lanceolatum]